MEVSKLKIIQNFVLLSCLSLFFMTITASESEPTIEIVVGQTSLLDYDNVTRVSIGAPDIADFKILKDSKQILFFGKKEGITDLRIWSKDGSNSLRNIQVYKESPVDKFQRVNDLLSEVEGIEIKQYGDQVFIQGSALTEEDYQRISFVASQYGVNNLVISSSITPRNMILMDVKVLEIRRSALKELGIAWQNSTSGPSFGYVKDFHANDLYRLGGSIAGLPLNTEEARSFSGINTSLQSAVNLLAENGLAKFLAEPKLTCLSGGEANFVAGGEIPIPIINENGSVGVQFKQYGIILGMKPVIDPSGFIRTEIDVEVSNVDDSNAVNGIPGFITRRTETEMNSPSGETLVISGLIQNNAAKDVRKIPGLGNIPILGELFKSRSFRTEESELIIFVTPNLIDSSSENNHEMLNRASEIKSVIDQGVRFELKD